MRRMNIENNKFKFGGTLIKILQILLIGFCTTIVRIIGQMLIPAGTQDILAPSVFVKNNTMPIVFSIYGIFTYSIIAALFLIIKDKMSGKRELQGIKYGLSCCVIWIAYLLEPLPHVAFIDKFTYPLADSIALLAMGLLCGILLGDSKPKSRSNLSISVPVASAMIIAFVTGRIFQYTFGNSYSLWKEKTVETLIWCVLTGAAISVVVQCFDSFIIVKNRIRRALIIGGVLFGVDLLLFNFFMPLVFAADIPDLILRTIVDIVAVTIGSLFLKVTVS